MEPLILYFRHEGIYKGDISQAAVTDSFLAAMLTRNAKVMTYTVSEDKKFSSGSKHITVREEPRKVILIGTIPYHLLIANLYRLEEQGFDVFIDTRFLTTEMKEPNYPAEFIRTWNDGGDL